MTFLSQMWTTGVQPVTQGVSAGGVHVGTVLMFVGGAILLAFFCSIGVIARLRENKIQERKFAQLQKSRQIEGSGPDSR